MKLFGDIYASFGFAALIITDRKLSFRRNADYQYDIQVKRRMEILFS